MPHHYNVLFLCTGNAARSIMAEAILNFKGRPTFSAYSAGSHPAGNIHLQALRQLERAHLPMTGMRSKSWDEFEESSAPRFDFVFTVRQHREGTVPGVAGAADLSALGPSRSRGASRN